MFDNYPESCPKLYECSRIRMAPMIRALLRCSAGEAMQSICTNCDERQGIQEVGEREEISFEKKS
jgi:hypothetical protein